MKITVELDVLDVCDDGKLKCCFNREIPSDDIGTCCFSDDESICDLFHEIITAYVPCQKCQDARKAQP